MIHNRQIERFGGTAGVRDLGLMESALAQPQATFGGELLHPTLADQAAAYLYHLAKNHPFVDSNKRTAFAVMDTFIRLNGARLLGAGCSVLRPRARLGSLGLRLCRPRSPLGPVCTIPPPITPLRL